MPPSDPSAFYNSNSGYVPLMPPVGPTVPSQTRGNTPSQVRDSVIPTGVVWLWALLVAPDGWLLCQGQILNRVTYARLFEAIGEEFGKGDGSTTFSAPDFRGYGPVGMNGATFKTIGTKVGEETHVLTTAEMPSHTHQVDTRVGIDDNNWSFNGGVSSDNNAFGPAFNTGTAGGGGAHNNIQPSLGINFIIKY